MVIFRTKKHNNQNAVSGLNSIMQGAKERISELGDRTMKDTQPQQQRQRRLTDKKNTSVKDLWDYNKRFKFHVIRIPGEEEKEDRDEKVHKEIIADNFLDLARDKPTDSRNWTNHKQSKAKECHFKKHCSYTAEY